MIELTYINVFLFAVLWISSVILAYWLGVDSVVRRYRDAVKGWGEAIQNYKELHNEYKKLLKDYKSKSKIHMN